MAPHETNISNSLDKMSKKWYVIAYLTGFTTGIVLGAILTKIIFL